MPKLIIIAGCNGAGKSTFATSFLPDGLISFDYDKLYAEINLQRTKQPKTLIIQ